MQSDAGTRRPAPYPLSGQVCNVVLIAHSFFNRTEKSMIKHKATLTQEERDVLATTSSKGTHRSHKVLNALTLLACDSGPL